MKLSELFERAINESLWDGVGPEHPYLSQYSCCAVEIAVTKHTKTAEEEHQLWKKAIHFLREMGVNTDSTSQYFYPYYESAQERQQARALWLTWAAMIAREEGL